MYSVCYVLCLSYHCWHHNSVLSSEGGWVLHRLEITRLVVSQGSPHCFYWLSACHSSLKKGHLAMGQFMPWLYHLPRMDQAPEPWRSAPDLLVLDDREAEALRKLFCFPSRLPWCGMDSPDPLSSLPVLLVLLPQLTPSLSLPCSCHLHSLPQRFTLPYSHSQITGWFFLRLSTVTLPYHCTYRPPSITCASWWSLSPSM